MHRLSSEVFEMDCIYFSLVCSKPEAIDIALVQIINKDNVQEGNNEANGYVISGGIVVVLPSAVIPDGSIL